MINHPAVSVFWLAAFVGMASPAMAAGEVLITQQKALAGSVTPGDAAGFPITLSRPGSYELASNIGVSANQIGIVVAARDVTIDFNGFELSGNDVAAHGIAGASFGATIKNGTVLRFRFIGINPGGAYWTVENMRVIENGTTGIGNGNVDHLRVVNSIVSENEGAGVVCDFYCHVQGNSISSNGSTGVVTSNGLIIGNTIVSNTGLGISTFAPGGYGHNNIALNNSSGDQVSGGIELSPNACFPAPC